MKEQKLPISFHNVVRALCVLVLTILASCAEPDSLPSIDIQRVPDNGIHPRIVLDEWGDTHLLYFRADPLIFCGSATSMISFMFLFVDVWDRGPYDFM